MSTILIPQETIRSAREAVMHIQESNPIACVAWSARGWGATSLAAREVGESAAPFPAASAPRNTWEASHSPLPIFFMALAIWAVIIAAVLWGV